MKIKGDPAVILGLGAVALTAIVASFSTLVGLAHYVGWQGRTGWLLPVCIDALAFAAGRVWLSGKAAAEARSYARNVSLTAIGISIVGNAIGHLVSMHHASPVMIALAIVVGSIPPAALAAVGHLFTLGIHTAQVEPADAEIVADGNQVPDETPAEPEVPSAPEKQPEPEPVPRRRGRKEALARGYWDAERAEGRTPIGAELAWVAGCDDTMGCRYVKKFEAEDAADQTKTGTRALALVGN